MKHKPHKKKRKGRKSFASKALSNPNSTGGIGHEFENKVQSAFVALMYAEGVAPCLPISPIFKVKLQGKYAGFSTDDAIVFTRDISSGKERKLLAQIKHSLAITKSDEKFGETICSAWSDFNNPKVFTRGEDVFALITGPLSAKDTYDVRDLLELARTSEDSSDFFYKVNLAVFSSDGKREKLSVIRHWLKIANKGKVSDDLTFAFIKHFYLLGYDLDIRGVCLSLVQSHLGATSKGNVADIWRQIREMVGDYNTHAGVITLESSKELREYFQIKTAPPLDPGSSTSATPAPSPRKPVTPPQSRPSVKVSTPAVAALLIGAWNEHNAGDRKAIESLTGSSFSDWQNQVRELLVAKTGFLEQQSGHWSLVDHSSAWKTEGPFVTDAMINQFSHVAVEVFKQVNPSLGGIRVGVNDNPKWCSSQLRKGIGETLALLATQSAALTTCASGLVSSAPILVVRELLSKATASQWASLNDVLPLLAEAAPNEYLEAAETGADTVKGVFQKERAGVFGQTYISGLLWGLEALAWHESNLVSTCRVLAELAAIDPGGNWTNRPSNSLTTILLPWFPQTCASAEKRHAAVEAVVKAQPQAGWDLIVSLLPTSHGVTSHTYKPKWRPYIPETWKDGASQKDYYDAVIIYFSRAISLAGTNTARLETLIDRYFKVALESRQQLRETLTSSAVLALPESERLSLWNAIEDLTGKHRKFAKHDNWKVPDGALEELDAVADKLRPTSPDIHLQRLFVADEYGLYEDLDNLPKSELTLKEHRQNAVRDLVKLGGFNTVLKFARSVDTPAEVGVAFASLVETEDTHILPSLLRETETKTAVFVQGFVRARFARLGWKWVDALPLKKWNLKDRAIFLSFLPFEDETWNRVRKVLSRNDREYWKRTWVYPSGEVTQLDYALGRLIDNGRADMVITYSQLAKRIEAKVSPAIAVRALQSLEVTEDRKLNSYHVGSLITLLQKEGIEERQLRDLEWKFIRLLGEHGHGTPIALSRGLAEDPQFFCKVLRSVYRPKHSREVEVSPAKREAARTAHQLLMEWRLIPGTRRDNSFDSAAFNAWLSSVKVSCQRTGHWEIAGVQIGKVLYHGKRDEAGLWDPAVCEAFDAKDHDSMRRGLTSEIFNRRGVFTFTKGKAEREIAEYWKKCASSAENRGYSRLGQSLRMLADHYFQDAEREEKRDF